MTPTHALIISHLYSVTALWFVNMSVYDLKMYHEVFSYAASRESAQQKCLYIMVSRDAK